jgi:hypothetical protein
MCAGHINICTQYNFGYVFALPLGVVMSFAYLIRQTKLTDVARVAQWTTQAHYIPRGLVLNSLTIKTSVMGGEQCVCRHLLYDLESQPKCCLLEDPMYLYSHDDGPKRGIKRVRTDTELSQGACR